MISTFAIEGFKCFRELELPELSRITVLGGKNNVGKTTVLEALFMFLDRLNPNMITRQYAVRGILSVPLTPEAVFHPVFTGYDVNQPIVLRARVNGIDEDLKIQYSLLPDWSIIPATPAFEDARVPGSIRTDEIAVPSFGLTVTHRIGGRTDQTSSLSIRGNSVIMRADKAAADVPLGAMITAKGRTDVKELATRYGQLDMSNEQSQIAEFLRIIEPRLASLSTITSGDISLIYGDVGIGKKIPIAYAGDGMSRLLEIIVFMATSKGGLVLIDEVENGIHYSVMATVWRAIAEAARRYDCQVVATTHSLECLWAAYEGISDDLQSDLSYIRLDKRNGDIRAKHYDRALLSTALKTSMELR